MPETEKDGETHLIMHKCERAKAESLTLWGERDRGERKSFQPRKNQFFDLLMAILLGQPKEKTFEEEEGGREGERERVRERERKRGPSFHTDARCIHVD